MLKPDKNNQKKYDLEERTAVFGEKIIEFCKILPKNIISIPIIGQLIKSATSIGANYNEADCAESKKDFIHKLSICKKESKESKHWLRMIAKAESKYSAEARNFWTEADELQRIFISIIQKTKTNIKNN